MKTLRIWITGFASVLALAACQPLQAQTTFDPIYFAGVVGAPQAMLTTKGPKHHFPKNTGPTVTSVVASPFGTSPDYTVDGKIHAGLYYEDMTISQALTTTAPTWLGATLDITDGTTVIGTQDVYAFVFSTTDHRDAFLYYLEQRDSSASPDSVYYDALASYELWMGQEDEGVALWYYYTGLGEYFSLTTADPQYAEFYYYYYQGLGAYFYYERQGDLESAYLYFSYYVSLANEAFASEPVP